MCGRFAVDKKPDEISAEVQALWGDSPPALPTWNCCPTSYAPVLSQNKLYSWSWGLIPAWAKDSSKRAGMINARIETLTEKPAYKNLLKRRQCIVPVNGYYEWQQRGEVKIPNYLYFASGNMMLMAGLWDKWISDKGEEKITFTIITREAVSAISAIHCRMPVILDVNRAKEWSSNKISISDIMENPPEDIHFHEVSSSVNSVKNNYPELIMPTEKPQLWQEGLF